MEHSGITISNVTKPELGNESYLMTIINYEMFPGKFGFTNITFSRSMTTEPSLKPFFFFTNFLSQYATGTLVAFLALL